jgi:hypothetical protein
MPLVGVRTAPPPLSANMGKHDGEGSGSGLGRIRKLKDKNAPKKPVSAFMLWSQHERPSVLATNPGLDFAGVGRKMGTLWAALGPDDKQVQRPSHTHTQWQRGRRKRLTTVRGGGTRNGRRRRTPTRSVTTARWKYTTTRRSFTSSRTSRRLARGARASAPAGPSGPARPFFSSPKRCPGPQTHTHTHTHTRHQRPALTVGPGLRRSGRV